MGEEIIVFFAAKTNLSGILSFAGIKLFSHSLEDVCNNKLDRIRIVKLPKFSDYVYEMLDGKIWIGHGIYQSDAILLKKSFERIGKTPPEAKYIIDTCDFLSSRKELAELAAYLGLGNQCKNIYEACRKNINAIKLFTEVISIYEPDMLKNYVDGDFFHPMISYIRDEEAVVTFEGIATLAPSGWYSVELHLSFLRLQRQADDFKIPYSSVVRLFLLPKSNQPHTFVVISLDPPVQKGQTMYPHIVMQFETNTVVEIELMNTKFKDKLEPSYKGLTHEVFTTVLCLLSGATITKPGGFRSAKDRFAVKSSLNTEDGVLYPLEKCFFFLPPTLILHDEIDYVVFGRHATAGGANMHSLDLLIRLKNNHVHLFRNIRRNEYRNLYSFISSKGLKIGAGLQDKEDEDDDCGSPTDDSGERGEKENMHMKIPAEDVGKYFVEKWFQMSVEERAPYEAKAEADKKRYEDEIRDYKNPQAMKVGSGNESDRGEKEKEKAKKDPNAPKEAKRGLEFFFEMEIDNVKKTINIPAGGVGKYFVEKWHQMSVEERAPYEAKAEADKKRYEDEIRDYKNPQAMKDEDDDGGSPTDDSGEYDSDASESGRGEKEKSVKKGPKREASSSKGLPPKKKAKKDPNAPKEAKF